MTFEEWWREFNGCCPLDITDEDMAKWAWEAGVQEGIDRMHKLYNICPQCKLPNGQHKSEELLK